MATTSKVFLVGSPNVSRDPGKIEDTRRPLRPFCSEPIWGPHEEWVSAPNSALSWEEQHTQDIRSALEEERKYATRCYAIMTSLTDRSIDINDLSWERDNDPAYIKSVLSKMDFNYGKNKLACPSKKPGEKQRDSNDDEITSSEQEIIWEKEYPYDMDRGPTPTQTYFISNVGSQHKQHRKYVEDNTLRSDWTENVTNTSAQTLVLLGTLAGKPPMPVRVLFDPGSGTQIISKKLAGALNLKTHSESTI